MYMKRILLILIPLLQLTLLVGCSSKTEEQPGDIYRKYAPQPGLTVAQVSDFELCDTVSVDVVMLVADNDSAWQQIVAEFDIRIDSGSTSWLAPIDQPATRTSWDNSPVLRVVALPGRRTVGIYRIDNEEQYDALLDYQLNNLDK